LTRDQLIRFFELNNELLDKEETRTKLRKLARTPDGTADLNRVMGKRREREGVCVRVCRL
jgi:hypothetical protein